MDDHIENATNLPTQRWLRYSIELEKFGQPVLLAFLLGTISIPLPVLRLFQYFWTKYFVGNVPGCLEFSTGVFVVVLCAALLTSRSIHSSWRGLHKSAKHLKRLTKQGVIDSGSCQIAFRWLFANVILRHIGGDPKQALDIAEFMKNPAFQQLLKDMRNL
jgi:hypothetical protein